VLDFGRIGGEKAYSCRRKASWSHDPSPARQPELKLQSMNFWKDYLRQVFRAFWHALERTDTLVIGVFILVGIMAAFGFFGGHDEHPS
jgi:hypothetical protein